MTSLAEQLSRSYQDTIERAVGYGDDIDITSSIAGGLSGFRLGITGIPVEWLDGMRGPGIIQPLVARLLGGAGYRTDEIRVDWRLVEIPDGAWFGARDWSKDQ
ncbi:hypothetical protein BH24CHL7_BH24CHL7_17330 [soil metagenome]